MLLAKTANVLYPKTNIKPKILSYEYLFVSFVEKHAVVFADGDKAKRVCTELDIVS